MSSNKNRSINETLDFIEECIHSNKLEFLAQLIVKLESEYIEIARISTDDNYKSNWTHLQVLDYLTYEQRP
jgi:type IV secretory pathway VirB4 component